MPEDFTLATPEQIPAKTTATYALVFLSLDWEGSMIVIRLRGAHGQLRDFRYGGEGAPEVERAKALALMVALNKANLATKSLQRRVLEQLVTDGLLAGTVTGTPA